MPPVKIGETMRAGGLGSVIAVGSGVKGLKLGDKVEGILGEHDCRITCSPSLSHLLPGWAEYAVLAEKHLQKRVPPPGADLSDFLGVLGMPGQTAYHGFIDVGKPKAGENVVVSGAGGAVGSTVCQIAKIYGCKVTGIAGGAEKCRWLEKELGIKAIDYKADNFVQEFKKIGYIDIYCE